MHRSLRPDLSIIEVTAIRDRERLEYNRATRGPSYNLLSDEVLLAILAQSHPRDAGRLMRVCRTWRRIMYEVTRGGTWWRYYRAGWWSLDILPRAQVTAQNVHDAVFDPQIKKSTLREMVQWCKDPLEFLRYVSVPNPRRVMCLIEDMIISNGYFDFGDLDEFDLGDKRHAAITRRHGPFGKYASAPPSLDALIHLLSRVRAGGKLAVEQLTYRLEDADVDARNVAVMFIIVAYKRGYISREDTDAILKDEYFGMIVYSGFPHCADYVHHNMKPVAVVYSDEDQRSGRVQVEIGFSINCGIM